MTSFHYICAGTAVFRSLVMSRHSEHLNGVGDFALFKMLYKLKSGRENCHFKQTL
jgi:hypothetical protein